MLRMVKFVIFLVVVGFAALTGFAYLGDLSPVSEQVTVPIELETR